MPRGPLGGPRPAASCTLEVKGEFNNKGGMDTAEPAEQIAMTSRIGKRSSSVRAFTNVKEVGDDLFDTIVVSVVLREPEILESEIEDMIAEMETVIGEKVSVEIKGY